MENLSSLSAFAPIARGRLHRASLFRDRTGLLFPNIFPINISEVVSKHEKIIFRKIPMILYILALFKDPFSKYNNSENV